MKRKRLFLATRLFAGLCAVLTSTTAFAAASWIGNSYIQVNGTWYNGSGTEWSLSEAFNGHDFNFVTELTIGASIQVYDEGTHDWNGGSFDNLLNYCFDYNGDDTKWQHINMSYKGVNGNNMVFETGGSSFTTTTLDMKDLSSGEHTLTIFFGPVDGNYDSNNSANYTATFIKAPYDISGDGAIKVEGINLVYTFTGSAINPVPVVKRGTTTLTEGTDYTVSYSVDCTNVGGHSVTITAKEGSNYTGSKTIDFYIEAYDFRGGISISGVEEYYEWTGSAIQPVPVVKIDETTLTEGTDYTVSYSGDCTTAGTHYVIITGKGNYKESGQQEFTINPGYFVVGVNDDWKINRSYQLARNTKTDANEYYIHNVILDKDVCTHFKVVSSVNGTDIQYWYPDGKDYYFDQSGTYSIYFRPDGSGNESYGWHEGVIYAEYMNVDVTLAPTGYGTYYNGTNQVTLPTGVVAYIVAGIANGKLTYNQIADGDGATKTVPAGTAVLLYSESVKTADVASTVTLIKNPEAGEGAPATNLLMGSDTETTTTGGATYYKLTYGSAAGHESNFGWYWGAADGATFTSPAHKAWLALPAATSRAFLGLPNDEMTGIAGVQSQKADDGMWYDLNGRRLTVKPALKGVYVNNGKKVVIR